MIEGFYMKKLSCDYVKNHIEKIGYKLLSKTYIGALSKLEIECDYGHQYKSTYANFQQGHKCPLCADKKRTDIKRHSYYYIKNQIENEGYKLLSNKYKNAFTELKIQCPEGHQYKVIYNCFQRGVRCPVCCDLKKHSLSEKDCLDVVKQLTNENIIENDRTQIVSPKTGYNLELDIWIPSLNKAIEFNGKYWHDNTYSKYKDNQKVIQCREKGIDLLTIWYQNWIDNREGQINNLEGFIRK